MVSIWRWTVTEPLEPYFARLISASRDAFAQMVARDLAVSAQAEPSLDQIEAENEAKLRGMDLPPDILEQTLKGFREMMAEARAEAAAQAAEPDEPASDAPLELGLAGSHMFFDDPYASLEHSEIDAQVADLMTQYRAAISKAAGHDGHSFGDYLGLSEAQLHAAQDAGVFGETGFDAVQRVWLSGEVVYYLSQWQEDRELPIDIGFGRADLQDFAPFKNN